MTIEKGKTSNGYAAGLILDSPNLAGGGYLTFFVSAIKNTIVKNIILNMYFNIATTSFPDYKVQELGGITAQLLHCFQSYLYRISPTRHIIHHNLIIFKIFHED